MKLMKKINYLWSCEQDAWHKGNIDYINTFEGPIAGVQGFGPTPRKVWSSASDST